MKPSRPADHVVRGVIRPDAFAPPRDALAVRDGRVIALGLEACTALTGPQTRVNTIDGVVVPGFIDAHVHPVMAGLELLRCDLSDIHGHDAYRERIRERAAVLSGEWFLGAGWYGDAFSGGFPSAAELDELVPDRPAVLASHDAHSVWVNSKAMEAAGIHAHTPDPAGGRILRDVDGRATGVLMESAMNLVRRLVPEPSNTELRQALLAAQGYLHARGIVGWQDAGIGSMLGYPDNYPVYRQVEAEGLLSGRVSGSLWWEYTADASQLPTLIARRAETLGSARFRCTSVKIMQDGVCENLTAAVLEPYRDSGNETGLSLIDLDELKRIVGLIGNAGFDLHIHTVGDRAVREALDAFSDLPRRPDARHQLAHIDLIDDWDRERMGEMGTIANVSPLWARRDRVLVETKLPYLNEHQVRRHFAFASLVRARVPLAFGSDWPVSSPDPLWAMHVAVNRTAPAADPHGDEHARTVALLAHEAISVEQAFDAATRGAARAARLDDNGTLWPGKNADFAILDADPLAVPPEQLSAVRVLGSCLAGEPVFTLPDVLMSQIPSVALCGDLNGVD